MAREINLVPDVKNEMIKTLKLRNFIFFLCVVVTAASIGTVLILSLIAGGQQLAIDSKNKTIDNLSNKLHSYSDLDDFLTIKDQLSNLSSISNNKKVLSRTFNILSALIPTGADTIQISKLNIDLTEENPTFYIEAQANAGKEPFIDYNVLDSFKKSMQYMTYDYGHYVDKNGTTIPAYCMIETDSNGAFFDSDKNIYAYWDIEGEGCKPSDLAGEKDNNNQNRTEASTTNEYSTEDYEGKTVVRIWRTPQNEWYKKNPTANEPAMTLEGEISNMPHFESACTTYTGKTNQDGSLLKWISSNEKCLLVPGAKEENDEAKEENNGILISESSNGRDSSGELVLRFAATITLAPEVYDFNNMHMIALAPLEYYNVTDSYVQIQAMFGERAKDCAADDTACNAEGGN